MKLSGNTILITGGGSGIGRELARRWHDLGNTVIVAGRTRDALEETAQGYDNIHAMTLDVAQPGEVERFAREVVERFPELNAVFNNAGIMKYEDITASRDLGDATAEVTINLLGPIRLTDSLVDHLKTRENPVIVNVTSGLAFVPQPKAATYSATKAALHSYTLSLRQQLKGSIEVIELAPPGVQTELTPGQSEREGYMPLDAYIEEVMTLFQQQPTPEEVCVEFVRPFRNAEKDGKVGEFMEMLANR
ncbi:MULTISPECIES: SDR family oxidoreductase [Citromicrobium]|uniref:SDR family oxidoreductase n=1 Tax=Citromicrobium TaxID=72173 RepID=UPI0001DD06A7|nr:MULTISPECIES: SDR family oxidoreductase [Citromicrobium]ALG62271.1 DltE [Citromicrobium sp. JL477]KPM14557.1 DltE [Citromicrobium sp. JL1351]KPM19857.1 DltE [Citromicrobium sp. JL31]KPM22812.1 DltE [Citromicrobium sp. JL2201]